MPWPSALALAMIRSRDDTVSRCAGQPGCRWRGEDSRKGPQRSKGRNGHKWPQTAPSPDHKPRALIGLLSVAGKTLESLWRVCGEPAESLEGVGGEDRPSLGKHGRTGTSEPADTSGECHTTPSPHALCLYSAAYLVCLRQSRTLRGHEASLLSADKVGIRPAWHEVGRAGRSTAWPVRSLTLVSIG